MTTETITPAGSPETQTSISATPVVAAPAITTPAAAITPQPDAAKPKALVEIPSDKLAERLAEERKKASAETRAEMLKSFGVTDEAQLKAAVTEAKRLEDEKRSDLEKRDVRIKELEPKAARAEALEAALKEEVIAAAVGLTEVQQNIVKSLAGDDPLRQRDAIRAFKSALPAAPVVTAPALGTAPAATLPPIPTAASTAAPAAPSPSGVTSPHIDHLAVWEGLKTNNDFVRASQYYLKNNAAIVAAQKARG